MTSDIIFRLRKRAEIRRSIPHRKSVQEGQPDRIADLLEEAANVIETQETQLTDYREKPMLADRLELLNHEITKLEKELSAMYEQIAIRENAAPAIEVLYDIKKTMLADYINDRNNIIKLLSEK